ncbi:MAG TPA: farnesyl diphosphate synthase [Gemmatimonadaceae bacterium]|nr:farnesyl diphosphate synthase [Gemmatimonadaceae bacterium]
MTARADFETERESIERRLDEICSTCLSELPFTIAAAVEYGLKSPGKRLRPLLLLFAYRAAGGTRDATLLACAPEVIHAYSLMHDDLPCMDDDDMRRGRPTVHKVYGSRTAILAGVAMIPLAARVVRDSTRAMRLSAAATESVVETLLEASGAAGMIGGQARDLAGEGLSLSLDEREAIHSAKTGAIIVASVRMGALAAEADATKVAALEYYGRSVGLAFQIMDDVLDVTSTTTAMGKTTGRDAVLGKSTYPALLGVDGARKRAQSLIEDGLRSLSDHGLLTQELSQVANFMVTRTS